MSRLIPMKKMKNAIASVLILSASLFAQTANTSMPGKSETKKNSDTKKNPAKTSTAKAADAKAVHDSALVIDTHADTTQRLLDEGFDLANPPAGDPGHLDFAKAKAGNLAAEFFSIWVEPKYQGQYAHRTLQLIDSVYQQAEKHPEKMMMAFSPADILAAHKQKKRAALLGIEGGHSIENDLGILRDYYRLGVRYMTLSWSNSNEWAESSGELVTPWITHSTYGRTDCGKEVGVEM